MGLTLIKMKEKAVFVCLSQQNFIELAQYPTASSSLLKANQLCEL